MERLRSLQVDSRHRRHDPVCWSAGDTSIPQTAPVFRLCSLSEWNLYVATLHLIWALVTTLDRSSKLTIGIPQTMHEGFLEPVRLARGELRHEAILRHTRILPYEYTI